MLNITRLYDMIFIKKYYTFMTTRKKRIMNNVCDTSALITFVSGRNQQKFFPLFHTVPCNRGATREVQVISDGDKSKTG